MFFFLCVSKNEKYSPFDSRKKGESMNYGNILIFSINYFYVYQFSCSVNLVVDKRCIVAELLPFWLFSFLSIRFWFEKNYQIAIYYQSLTNAMRLYRASLKNWFFFLFFVRFFLLFSFVIYLVLIFICKFSSLLIHNCCYRIWYGILDRECVR